MSKTKKIENKRKEILELFDTANLEPELAKDLIESKIDKPYTRALASDITRDNIMELSDYHVQNYYQDILYKLWNYAEKQLQMKEFDLKDEVSLLPGYSETEKEMMEIFDMGRGRMKKDSKPKVKERFIDNENKE